MTTVIRTADEPAVTRMDYWRSVVCDTMVPLDMGIERPEDYQGQLVNSDLGSTQVTEITTSSTVVRRTPKHIRVSDPALYKLELQTRGTSVLSQRGRDALLTPGDLTVADQTRPYLLAAGYSPRSSTSRPGPGVTHQALTFTFPHELLPLPIEAMARTTAVRMSTQAPVTRLVTPVLRHLAQRCADQAPDAAIVRRLSSVVLELLAVGLAEQLDRGRDVPPDCHRRALLQRIRAFIEQHLDRVDLSPDMIAAAHHISLRYLHRLFEPEATTVADHIRRRRLEQCRRELVDPARAARPAATIAARWGFGSAEHFSRLFRAAYGVPPGEYRSRQLGQAG